MPNDQEKLVAARASMDFVREGMIVGIGTGSTAECTIRLLGDMVKAGLKIRAIPSSLRSKQLAATLQIPLTTLEEVQDIDVYIDGADEIDPQMQLIKGGGGALLREKVVASAAKQIVVIADSSKQVEILGKFPLPLEVIGFAEALVSKRITALGAVVSLRKYPYGNPYKTDEGNHILDCNFGRIPDPVGLARILSAMPGVVEHGLFIDMADVILIGKGTEVAELRP